MNSKLKILYIGKCTNKTKATVSTTWHCNKILQLLSFSHNNTILPLIDQLITLLNDYSTPQFLKGESKKESK